MILHGYIKTSVIKKIKSIELLLMHSVRRPIVLLRVYIYEIISNTFKHNVRCMRYDVTDFYKLALIVNK